MWSKVQHDQIANACIISDELMHISIYHIETVSPSEIRKLSEISIWMVSSHLEGKGETLKSHY